MKAEQGKRFLFSQRVFRLKFWSHAMILSLSVVDSAELNLISKRLMSHSLPVPGSDFWLGRDPEITCFFWVIL
jgi:hypothetical protein